MGGDLSKEQRLASKIHTLFNLGTLLLKSIPEHIQRFDPTRDVLHDIYKAPWWVVLSGAMTYTAVMIFVSGLCAGAMVDRAYKRVQIVAKHREQMVMVPLGYVSLPGDGAT